MIDPATAVPQRRAVRVARWVVAHEPFTPHNGLAGPSGAMRRAAVLEHYRDAIDQLYAGDPHHVAV